MKTKKLLALLMAGAMSVSVLSSQRRISRTTTGLGSATTTT